MTRSLEHVIGITFTCKFCMHKATKAIRVGIVEITVCDKHEAQGIEFCA